MHETSHESNGKTAQICKDSYAQFDSVCIRDHDDPRQRIYYLFNRACAMPEFIIEYEVIPVVLSSFLTLINLGSI